MRLTDRHVSFLRFLVVGVLSLATDAGSLWVLHGAIGLWLPVATATAYGVAFIVNFGLNRIWVFRSSGAVGRQVPKYVGLVIANLLVTVAAVQWLTWLGVQYMFAKLITAAILAVVNYFVSRLWIFDVSAVGAGRGVDAAL